MLKLTLIARVSDQLPLAASMEDDKEVREMDQYKKQRKKILKQLSLLPNPPEKMSVDSGEFAFHILTESGVAFMTLCEKQYSTQLAYSFLADLKGEFFQLHGSEVSKVERPYPFIKFDTFIQKTKRVYSDTRTKRNLQKLKEELNDVQQIIRKNVQDVIGRGDRLEEMQNKSSAIAQSSTQFKVGTKELNRLYYWKTYGPPTIIFLVVILVFVLRFYLF